MQHLKTGFLHAAWADDKLFKKLQEIPEDCLGFIYADPECPVGRVGQDLKTITRLIFVSASSVIGT